MRAKRRLRFELIRLDRASHAAVTAFLEHEEGIRDSLPTIWLAAGTVGSVVGALCRASGVTLGRLIFLGAVEGKRVRDRGGRRALEVIDDLLVHECVHVIQYQKNGFNSFLYNYIKNYLASIFRQRRLDRRGRNDAYRAIPAEIEANAVAARWLRSALRRSFMNDD